MGRWVKIVMMACGEFLGRKWNLQDLVIASTLSPMHFLSLFAPCYFAWGAFWVAFALHMLTSLGVTLSFHRNLSHKSFRLPKWLEYLFAYVAVLSLQVHYIYVCVVSNVLLHFSIILCLNSSFFFLAILLGKMMSLVCCTYMQGSPIEWVS